MCSNNVSILHTFFDTTTFTVYVTVCKGRNLEKSFIFGKQLQLKTIDNFPFTYAHNHAPRHSCRGRDKKPEIITHYNAHEGGVDNIDHLVGT